MDIVSGQELISSDPILDEASRPPRKGGWGEDSKGKTKRKRNVDMSVSADSEVLEGFGEAIDNIPLIPDVEDLRDEEKMTTTSAPPSVAIHRVTAFKQLELDLNKQTALYFMDGKIDLKLLAKSLCPEEQIKEEDKPWQLDRLLTELQSDFERAERGNESVS